MPLDIKIVFNHYLVLTGGTEIIDVRSRPRVSEPLRSLISDENMRKMD